MCKCPMCQVQSPTPSCPHPTCTTCPVFRFTGGRKVKQQGASLAAMENTTLNILILFSLNINHNIYINAIYYNLFLFKHVHRSEIK